MRFQKHQPSQLQQQQKEGIESMELNTEKVSKRWWRSPSAKQPSAVSPKGASTHRGTQSEQGLFPSSKSVSTARLASTLNNFSADKAVNGAFSADAGREEQAGHGSDASGARGPRPPLSPRARRRGGSDDAADPASNISCLKNTPSFRNARLEQFRSLIDQRNVALAMPQLRLEPVNSGEAADVIREKDGPEWGKVGTDGKPGVSSTQSVTSDSTLSAQRTPVATSQLENLSSFNSQILRSPRGLHRMSSELRRGASDEAEPLPSNEQVKGFIDMLDRGTTAEKESAMEGLLKLSRISPLHRQQLGDQGVVPSVARSLDSPSLRLVEQSVTIILNLALQGSLKEAIGTKATVKTLTRLAGSSEVEVICDNAAAALCNLASAAETRKILMEAGVVPLLLNRMQHGTNARASRDAAVGLFNLSIDPDCKEQMVEHGTLSILLGMLQEDGNPCEEEAAHFMASLAKSPTACACLEREDEAILTLAGLLEEGNPRTQASVVSTLLQVAHGSAKGKQMVADEGILPALAKVVETGIPRGREKAASLIAILRPPTKSGPASPPTK
eukprot:TRINITY_DN5325_c0_g1_i1.p1 TRINITY_DN5325_c0_g1~~TRINITY_DN5325_c0_g1_i1.p1  ORF type:complete len:559 (+),score=94.57 TRINITY_DN5325_c0_g1_i1:105-1781(+)